MRHSPIVRFLRGAPPRANPAPGAAGHTWDDLREWLREAIPVFVLRGVLLSRALKVCSLVSPEFARVARARGFDAWVASRPGHVFNVVLLADGAAVVDLSAVQFECRPSPEPGDHSYGQAERREVRRLLDAVRRNPFRAARVTRVSRAEAEAMGPEEPGGGVRVGPGPEEEYAGGLADLREIRALAGDPEAWAESPLRDLYGDGFEAEADEAAAYPDARRGG